MDLFKSPQFGGRATLNPREHPGGFISGFRRSGRSRIQSGVEASPRLAYGAGLEYPLGATPRAFKSLRLRSLVPRSLTPEAWETGTAVLSGGGRARWGVGGSLYSKSALRETEFPPAASRS